MVDGKMWVRSAFWVGRARDEAVFEAAINDELVPALKVLPGVNDAQALWPRRCEDGAPGIACQILVHFSSQADVDRMLASPERHALRTRVVEIVKLFDGQFSHIDYEVA